LIKEEGSMDIEGIFNPERRRLALVYNKEKRKLSIGTFSLKTLFWLLILGFSLEKRAYKYLHSIGLHPELELLIYLFAFYLLYSLVSLLSAYYEYGVERKYQLSNQTKPEWLIDEVKSLILGLLFFFLAARGYLYLVERFPENWWLYYAITAGFFILLIAFVFPVLLVPLFFKLGPYPESELKDQLWQLVKKAGVKIDDIYEINLSSKVNAANAAVMGLGKSRKIVLSDNLQDKYSPGEIEAVLAHELGHQVKGDMAKNILAEFLSLLLTLFLVFKTWPFIVSLLAYDSIYSVVTIPALSLFVSLLSWLLSPLRLSLSRRWEKEADLYAVQLTGQGESLARALAKLADEALIPLKIGIYRRLFKASHPPVRERIEYILEK
jgi:STE24 endopeptidase